ncbi:hypothetical protein L596_023291 [Steinernema carpocapsae]|uniref:Kindlin-2 N-terminal domain-containing protein n=1 Tax=Steinernema carpocapsae TaxID=34508 RepID=A0A4U5MD68_STECR|nr:hypothetical protein L596_023291 [Steinernema carpocapsae]
MAHLVDGASPVDGTWKLPVFVTDLNVQRDVYVRGDQHIGGVMLKLVEQVDDVQRDWSDHALWWPEKCRWLTHTRSTLDQLGITAATYAEFTPMHKSVLVQLPDLQEIEMFLDFSVPVVRAVQELCRELGIRYSEELSLKRYFKPDALRRGVSSEADQPVRLNKGEESVGPGTLRRQQPIRASTIDLHGKRHMSRGCFPESEACSTPTSWERCREVELCLEELLLDLLRTAAPSAATRLSPA